MSDHNQKQYKNHLAQSLNTPTVHHYSTTPTYQLQSNAAVAQRQGSARIEGDSSFVATMKGTANLDTETTEGKTSAFKKEGAQRYKKDLVRDLKIIVNQQHGKHYGRAKRRYTIDKDNNRDAKELYASSDIEGPVNAARSVVNALYGGFLSKKKKAKKFKAGKNLKDPWTSHQKEYKEDLKASKKKAREVLQNWAISKSTVHLDYNATPSGKQEKIILKEAIEEVLNTKNDDKTYHQLLSETLMAYPGAAVDQDIFVAHFKASPNENDPQKQQSAKKANTKHLWKIFYTSIHEYLHTAASPDFKHWALSLGGEQSHTLREGFCEFFTQDVIAAYPSSKLEGKLQEQVEGSYYKKSNKVYTAQEAGKASYTATDDAERVVGATGIHNAMLAYFKGDVALLGAVTKP